MAGSTNLKDLVFKSLAPGGKDYVKPEKVKPSMKRITKGKGTARTVFTERQISEHMKKYKLPRGVAIIALDKKRNKPMLGQGETVREMDHRMINYVDSYHKKHGKYPDLDKKKNLKDMNMKEYNKARAKGQVK